MFKDVPNKVTAGEVCKLLKNKFFTKLEIKKSHYIMAMTFKLVFNL